MASTAERAVRRGAGADPETHVFADDGVFPNSRLPVLIYRGVLATPNAAAFEQMFEANGWSSSWRNGLFSVHHYHSTAHEVLGIAAGSARVRLGGENGAVVELRAGDVVVIPAGVAHKREAASADLLVIGAYPKGQSPDMCRADEGAHDKAAANVAAVPMPAADPVTGRLDPLLECWSKNS